MLGLLEKLVTDAGGTWVMRDTDSMAIVASPARGFVSADPMTSRTVSSEPVAETDIPVLSFDEVERVRARFEQLNPYSVDIPFLKREYPHSPDVYCYAVSAKRYALFTFDESGDIKVFSEGGRKEHGLVRQPPIEV
jgi:hypothetical protein